MKITVTLSSKDRPYTFTPDYDYDEPYAALWMWTEGNYGCDCNKSIHIQQHCHNGFHWMECGELINLVSVVAEDGTRVYPEPDLVDTRRTPEGNVWTWDSDPTARGPFRATVTQREGSGLWIVEGVQVR